jgi:hypothetical protein
MKKKKQLRGIYGSFHHHFLPSYILDMVSISSSVTFCSASMPSSLVASAPDEEKEKEEEKK